MQPVDGSGFVPISQGAPGAAPATAAAPSDGTSVVDADKGLAAITQIATSSDSFGGKPIVTANGMVYVPRKPTVKDGKIVMSYMLAGKVADGKMMINPDFMAVVKELTGGSQDGVVSEKVVKEGESYYRQTTVKGDNGELVAKMTPMSDAEVQAYAQKVQQAQAQQDAQTAQQNNADWSSKLYKISGNMRLVSTLGNFVEGLSAGPDPLTGKGRSSWMTGWFALQMLDSQSGGKLLPAWTKQGPGATMLEWGMQLPFLASMGDDLKVLGAAFPRTAAVMRTFTSPTRAVLHGVSNLGSSVVKATLPGAAAAAAGSAGAAAAADGAMGVAAAAQAAANPMDEALVQLGKELRMGQAGYSPAQGATVALGTGVMADSVGVMSSQGLQLVPKGSVQKAMQMTEPVATGLGKVQPAINKGVMGVLGGLRPFLQPLAMGASLFGAIGGAIGLKQQIKTEGFKSLYQTQQGRGYLLGFGSSAAFLGMMMLPMVAPQARVLSAGLNVASNLFQAVSSLNYGGLFGDGGYLDHDVARAAFLIPPLTPIGMFGIWMKQRKKAAAAKEQAQAEKVKQLQANLQNFQTQAAQQLQQSGSIAGAVAGKDGTIDVVAPFTTDGSALSSGAASQPQQADGGAGDGGRTLHMLSQRVR